MNFIKKYSALLIPIVIVIVAVILFIPTILIGRSVSKNIQSSISQGSQLKSLESKAPSRDQYKQEKAYQDNHEQETKQIEELGKQSTLRELLSYEVFPKPKETSQQIFVKFGEKFRAAIDGPAGLVKRMNALDAPSEIDIQKETGVKTGGSRRGRKSQSSRAKGTGSAIGDAVCRRRAEEISVYANPDLFGWYTFWEDYEFAGAERALEDCWNSQVVYWIYEDVIETIRVMNIGSNSVYTSPVKRLLGISFVGSVMDVDKRNKNAGRAIVSAERPSYLMGDEESVLGVKPWTDRKCNDDLDVVHFSVAVIVSSKTFMPFIRELCSVKEHAYREGYLANGQRKTCKHNQITVLTNEIKPVDLTASGHENYRYGEDAVIRLDLNCEYIFYRSGYDDIKPDSIKQLLGQSINSKQDLLSGSSKKSSTKKKAPRLE